jgi:hypothetical protein
MADILNNLQKEFYGDDVRFFIGIVEDNTNDPDFLGRVRVRILGLHNAYTEDVPTEKLPWATVLVPATYGGVSGVGRSPNGIENGSWVFGMFMDGKHSQSPVIFGTMPKIELKSGDDITPEKRIRPVSIEGTIGQTPTSFTSEGDISVNLAGELVVIELASQAGLSQEAGATIAGYLRSYNQGEQ